ncbi:MAG: metallophosphoesterase [Myxococcales bacterium]|nr:MAG: metallophosphoesterase [Myxococcales bacterium]
MLCFVHSSDWQLGMPFNWAEGDAGAKLRALRMEGIDRLGELAKEKQAQFILVAGDLFDANTVSERIVIEACERIAALPVPVFVIPGNHDHGGPGSIYRHDSFGKNKPENMTVMTEKEPLTCQDWQVCFFPAPLLQRHEAHDPTEHITAESGEPGFFRIGIAHGSIRRFDQSGDGTVYNLIDPRRAKLAKLDYLALGDWHGTEQIDARTWFSGAHEPTNFKGNDTGNALLVRISEVGAVPEVEKLHVAKSQWLHQSFSLFNREDIEALRQWITNLDSPRHALLELELKGALSLADLSEVDELVRELSHRLLVLRTERRALLPAASEDELDALAADGYVRMAVERLRELQGSGDVAAARALQLLHQLKHQPC